MRHLPLSVLDVVQKLAPGFLDMLSGMTRENPLERMRLEDALACCYGLLDKLSAKDLSLPYDTQDTARSMRAPERCTYMQTSLLGERSSKGRSPFHVKL